VREKGWCGGFSRTSQGDSVPAPVLTSSDFAEALGRLLPRGRVWTRDPDGIQAALLLGLAGVTARQTLRSNFLLVDEFPASTTELLSDWEDSLGLPDPCAGEDPAIVVRRRHVVARFTNGGGQSAPYFIAYAAALGYTITIENFAPFRAGRSRAGDPDYGPDWAHTWAIHAPLDTVTAFEAGQSAAGDPLASWGNEILECEMNAIKPAHAILQFRYA
jgi:uncharacterized protein YmfQ (DUF2313 family)